MSSLLLFAASFYISWLLFAIIYYIICHVHGDFEPEVIGGGNSSHPVCVLEIYDFGE